MSGLSEGEFAVLSEPCECGHDIEHHGSLAGCWDCLEDNDADECELRFMALLGERVDAIAAARITRLLDEQRRYPIRWVKGVTPDQVGEWPAAGNSELSTGAQSDLQTGSGYGDAGDGAGPSGRCGLEFGDGYTCDKPKGHE